LVGIENLSSALAVNKHLRYLNLSENPLQNFGIACLAKALKTNEILGVLDLFGVYFSDDGCIALMEAVLFNKSLHTLILANTDINP
jgi:Ran GTPase-activating protein (RanGAP) involved in mRNA processing and transport